MERISHKESCPSEIWGAWTETDQGTMLHHDAMAVWREERRKKLRKSVKTCKKAQRNNKKWR